MTVPEPVGVTVKVKFVGGGVPPPPEPPVPPLPPLPLPPVFPELIEPHAAKKSMHKRHNATKKLRYCENMA